MLYKLMIVDDEESIREGIAKSIPWAEWGFEVSARCANGLEALGKIADTQPDVVLSDIRMPKMDGVELMSRLHEQYPQIKVVILSGYSDFEYLNMSIKNKVAEYLLKPTDLDEFEDVFHRLKATLDEEQKDRQRQMQNEKLLFFAWLDKLLRGRASGAENEIFVPKAEQYRLWLENSAVLVLSADSKPADKHLLVQLQNRIAEIASTTETSFFVTGEDIVAGVYGVQAEHDLDYEHIFKFAKYLQHIIRTETHHTVSVGISELCTEMQMLPQAYEQAKCCANQNMFFGSESVFRYSQLEEEIPEKDIYFCTERLEKALLAGKEDEILQEFQRVFSLFHQHPLKEYRFVDQLCLSCLFELSRWALQYNVRMEKLLHRENMAYSQLNHCHTLDAKCEFMTCVLQKLARELHSQRTGSRKNGSVAYQVRQLVDNEFGSNAMSLEYVATKVHKSPAYISKVFKNELNCNFSDYITKLRMEHAARLLGGNNPPKIYEVAAECGYADVSNFIKVFKKYHNESPSEYRSALLRSGE